MRYIRYIQAGWILLLAVLVLGVSIINPALASNKIVQQTSAPQQSTGTSINAIIYQTIDYMAAKFQASISRRVPDDVNTAITAMVSKLPRQDQGWAYQMATTLIQPSASLVNLTPQQGGLAITLRLSLYPGDPRPITSTLLFSFSVLNSSTAQVSASPINGSPALVSGPVDTFQVPLGQLNRITATPSCGVAALAFNLQFPVSLGHAQAGAAVPGAPVQIQLADANPSVHKSGLYATLNTQTPTGATSFIEIPASSLAALGSSVGSLPVGSSFTAENIQIGVQGSNLALTSDIYWSGLNIGTSVTTVAPSASGGKMVAHVLNTDLSLFGLFSFPLNSYNAQIEQTLNSKIGNAFAGKFYVTQAVIGPTSQLTCAAHDSLVLAGSSSMG